MNPSPWKLMYAGFVAALCVLAASVAQAQTATSPRANTLKMPSAMNFVYDAQHDQVNATGIQLKPSAMSASGVTPTTGMIVVTIGITDVSHFTRGTSYHCSLTAIGGEIDTDNGTVDGGIATANAIATWSGSNALSCTLTIPYSWTLPTDANADTGLILAFGVSAMTHASGSTAATVERSTLQLDGIENLPASGATSTFSYSVTL